MLPRALLRQAGVRRSQRAPAAGASSLRLACRTYAGRMQAGMYAATRHRRMRMQPCDAAGCSDQPLTLSLNIMRAAPRALECMRAPQAAAASHASATPPAAQRDTRTHILAGRADRGDDTCELPAPLTCSLPDKCRLHKQPRSAQHTSSARQPRARANAQADRQRPLFATTQRRDAAPATDCGRSATHHAACQQAESSEHGARRRLTPRPAAGRTSSWPPPRTAA